MRQGLSVNMIPTDSAHWGLGFARAQDLGHAMLRTHTVQCVLQLEDLVNQRGLLRILLAGRCPALGTLAPMRFKRVE